MHCNKILALGFLHSPKAPKIYPYMKNHLALSSVLTATRIKKPVEDALTVPFNRNILIMFIGDQCK